MVYTKELKLVEVVQEGGEEVLKLNYEPMPYIPSIEDNPLVMMDAIDKLIENPSAARISFAQRRRYNYNYEQTKMLVEIANIYSYFIKSRRATSLQNLGLLTDPPELLGQRLSALQYLLTSLLKQDPLSAYAELKRAIRRETINLKTIEEQKYKDSVLIYLRILQDIFDQLEKTTLIAQAREYLAGYTPGDREVYKLMFRPTITPDFMYSKIAASPPLDGEQLDIYKLNSSTEIAIFRTPNEIKNLYHMTPPEFKLSEDKFELLDLAKKVLSEHQPQAGEFLDPERMRGTFTNISKDLIRELAEQRGMLLKPEEIAEMAEILVRHTIGFGVIELLLEDEKIQDITINSPMGQVPIFILHSDHNECTTNIIPTSTDFESWATKFRLISGRPLDEANPILDTEIITPKARSRLSVIGKPLNPYGYGMSFRRHRDTPWTLPLFIKNGMISPLGAGLLSFTIDGARAHLIAGTRSSGKTSFLSSLLLEIMRKYRVLTIEDSVSGESEILFKERNILQKRKIGDLINRVLEQNGSWYNLTGHETTGNTTNIEVLSMNKEGKLYFSKVSKFIRHKVEKPMYYIKTSTGRDIEVTGDHSLFFLNEDGCIAEIKPSNIKEGDFLATPRKIPHYNESQEMINILDYKNELSELYFKGGNLQAFLQENKKLVKQIGKELGYERGQIAKWIRLGLIPGKVLDDLSSFDLSLKSLKGLRWKKGKNSFWLPIEITLDGEFLTLLGLWLADGCYDKNSTLFSVGTKEEIEVVRGIAKRFDFGTHYHSDNFTLMIHSSTFKFLLREILGLKGDAYTKRIPSWMFNLSSQQIGFVLKGIFSGDGCVTEKEIVISLCSKQLVRDIQTLLLFYGVIFRIGKQRESDKTYPCRISNIKSFKIFKTEIGILQSYKKTLLDRLCNKKSTHDSSDIIPLSKVFKKKMSMVVANFNKNDYIIRGNHIGREKLFSINKELLGCVELSEQLQILAMSDLLWDKVREIRVLPVKEQYVYDLSVPENESFVCNNMVAHNTLELPTEAMRKLGYNIQPLKVRAALTKSGSEISAEEGIRTSLRLGDSALIVGEVRSTEAIALFEAMRIGASANVVAGTIHADSPYGVFDRIANDLKVPKTSFKATDIIIICNPIRSADGMKKVRRVLSITEVRKEWEEDPVAERGFVDLMRYNAKKDILEPTPELMNGESEILKGIGANVREWVGNWDAIWDNIVLRADLKKMLVDYSDKVKMPDLLEAEFSLQGNDMFHRITESVQAEVGSGDTKRIKFEWEEWLKREVRKKQLG
ncbi:MAG: ATPase, T2SS/T4P/T4SS family [bacterium]|nr:ATPase, T2SS/T4P/T4SS family [bacterium]